MYNGFVVTVVDQNGRTCFESNLNVKENEFYRNLSGLSSGIFSLQINCDQMEIETIKLIIAK